MIARKRERERKKIKRNYNAHGWECNAVIRAVVAVSILLLLYQRWCTQRTKRHRRILHDNKVVGMVCIWIFEKKIVDSTAQCRCEHPSIELYTKLVTVRRTTALKVISDPPSCSFRPESSFYVKIVRPPTLDIFHPLKQFLGLAKIRTQFRRVQVRHKVSLFYGSGP